ncbi:MAG: hypothetical protein HHJ09_02575 [Glaciimonas sp.]|nr:hypothetical protein [Glaciimonas sp.]
MTNNDALDASIPVLTEIIEQGQIFIDAEAAPSPPSPALMLPAALRPDADETTEAPDPIDVLAPTTISDSQWEALERKISERVLSQLQARIDFVLEHRVRDSLADALQLAVEGMAAEIKRGLHHTLEDVIARAVAQEITHLKTNKNTAAEPPA